MEGFGNQDQLRRNDRTSEHTAPGQGMHPTQQGTGKGTNEFAPTGQGVFGGQQHHQNKQKGMGTGAGITDKLHRSNSSSSSSESDGEGGRRKKGIKDKIKEKIPGQHNQGATGHQGFTQNKQGYGATGQHGQQEGMMDKFKDNLPGNH